jgi:hypothetical protein
MEPDATDALLRRAVAACAPYIASLPTGGLALTGHAACVAAVLLRVSHR